MLVEMCSCALQVPSAEHSVAFLCPCKSYSHTDNKNPSYKSLFFFLAAGFNAFCDQLAFETT